MFYLRETPYKTYRLSRAALNRRSADSTVDTPMTFVSNDQRRPYSDVSSKFWQRRTYLRHDKMMDQLTALADEEQ